MEVVPNLEGQGFNEAQKFQYEVRGGREDDIELMELVLERATAARNGEAPPERRTDTEKYEELKERMSKPGAWSHLAWDGERLAGFVMGHPSGTESTISPDEATEYLALLMTDPEYWGRGVGSVLLDEAARTAGAQGKEHMVLWTAVTNLRGRQLYERKGYHLTGATRDSVRQGSLVQYEVDLV